MKCVTSKIDLGGCGAGGAIEKIKRAGDTYYPAGTGITTSSYQFQFQWPHAKIQSAIWRMCWAVVSPTGEYNAGRCINRLVHCDNGPVNRVAFAYIDSNDNPRQNTIHNRAVDITAQMEELRCAGVFKNVLWEVSGDNTNYAEFLACWIEIVWDFDC